MTGYFEWLIWSAYLYCSGIMVGTKWLDLGCHIYSMNKAYCLEFNVTNTALLMIYFKGKKVMPIYFWMPQIKMVTAIVHMCVYLYVWWSYLLSEAPVDDHDTRWTQQGHWCWWCESLDYSAHNAQLHSNVSEGRTYSGYYLFCNILTNFNIWPYLCCYNFKC